MKHGNIEIKKLSEECKRLREEAGLSQGELAEKIGMSSSMISKWEKKKIHLSLERIVQLLDALGYCLAPSQKKTTSLFV